MLAADKAQLPPFWGTAAAREPLAQDHAPPLGQPTSTGRLRRWGLSSTWGQASCGWGLPGKGSELGLLSPGMFQFLLGSLWEGLSPHLLL